MTCCETLDDSLTPYFRERRDEIFFQRENWNQQVKTGVLRSPLTANRTLKDNALRLYSLYPTLYSRRSMTWQSDALFAFSGILKDLEQSVYKEGMFWALPCADLNWALYGMAGSRIQNEKVFPLGIG